MTSCQFQQNESPVSGLAFYRRAAAYRDLTSSGPSLLLPGVWYFHLLTTGVLDRYYLAELKSNSHYIPVKGTLQHNKNQCHDRPENQFNHWPFFLGLFSSSVAFLDNLSPCSIWESLMVEVYSFCYTAW